MKDRFIAIFIEFGLSREWAEICYRNRRISDELDTTAWDHAVMISAEGWERYGELGWC